MKPFWIRFLSSVFAGMIFLGLFCGYSCAGDDTTISNKTHVYALKYGASKFKLKDIYLSEKTDKTIEFVWLFYLVILKDRKILIDTGFSDRQRINYYRLTSYTHPSALLLQMGIKPDDITDVIITHKHFDHSGLVYLYQKANIYIQKEEFQSLLSKRNGTQSAQISNFLQTSGLLHVLEGNYSISPSIEIKKSGGHTLGSQMVLLKSEDTPAPIIFAGDECYLVEGCKKTLINNLTENRTNNLQTLIWLKNTVIDSSAILLTFHDPEICLSFPQIHKNIFQIQ